MKIEIQQIIHVFIHEPITSVTDIILSFICFYFFYTLYKIKKRSVYLLTWRKFFLFIGFSTFFGGIAHAMYVRENNIVYDTVWLLMQVFAGVSVFFAQIAAYRSEIPGKRTQKILRILSLIQLIVFVVCMFCFFNFKVVAINSFIGLVLLIVVHFPASLNNWIYKTFIISGLLLSFVTVYVNRTKFSFSTHFNHNDISHVIMYVSLLLIYKGVKYKHKTDSLFVTT